MVPPRPTSSASSKVGPRRLPIPNAFGRHITNSATALPTSHASPASPSGNTTRDDPPRDLGTINAQRDVIKDLRAQIVRCHVAKQLTTARIKTLERRNQQLHQDALWGKATMERLERGVEIGEAFAERNDMVEVISKTLAVELVLAKRQARKLEEKREGVVGM